MNNPVSQIKDRLTIAEVIGGYLKLERAGQNFRARCPFHNEKTPSFFISPARQSFYCFGCHKGGDIFTFIEEMEHLDFRGALKMLGERAGVAVEGFDQVAAAKEMNKVVLWKKIMTQATLFYQRELAKNEAAINYLKGRGLTKESVLTFKIGYAPNSWDSLTTHMLSLKVAPELLIEMGLALRSSKDQKLFDRFRGRIMFPLFDQNGQVVGFTGRLFDDEATRTNEGKYVNSPQTPLYDKSKLLYGLHLAKQAIREKDEVILVEGQMDLIMSHQAGVANCVAVSGTALTDTHLKALKLLTSNIKMAFDADSAGFKASQRALVMCLSLGLDVRAIETPGGKDPADIVLHNSNDWLEAVSAGSHVIDYYLARLKVKASNERELLRLIQTEVLPIIKLMSSALDQAYFVKKVADGAGVAEEALAAELKKVAPLSLEETTKRVEISAKEKEADPLTQTAIYLMALLDYLKETNEPSFFEAVVERLKPFVDLSTLTVYQHDDYHNRLLFEFEASGPPNNLEDVILELGKRFKTILLKQQLTEETRKLKEAERKGDQTEIDKLLKLCQDITQDLKSLTTH